VTTKKINYTDNPFLSNSAKDLIYVDMERLEDSDFNHIYLGEPKTDDDDAIIKRKWIMSCIDAHKKLDVDVTGGKRMGYDVADSGEDLNAYILMNGGLVETLESWKANEDELYESSLKVYTVAREHNAKVNYDSNGVGAGVGSNMNQMNNTSKKKVDYFGFDSAETPAYPGQKYKVDGIATQQTNREYFENRKAQAWWMLADRIKATHRAVTSGDKIDKDIIFSISSRLNDLEKLITELSTPRKKMSGRLKNIVEKKDDLKRRGIKSPNLAEALIMASYPFCKTTNEIKQVKLSFA
jgi:phage terminase large subunit